MKIPKFQMNHQVRAPLARAALPPLLAAACLSLLCSEAVSAQFQDVTASAGITDAPGYCFSAAWGDYDNDGHIDLYLAIGADTSGLNALFRNNGDGTFTRVGAEAGPIATDSHDSAACAWLDINNDGFRDMFVVNGGWGFSQNDLYWNNGDGTFRSGNAGDLTQLSLIRGWSASADCDGDGRVEILMPEGTSFWGPLTNHLYRPTGLENFVAADLVPAEGYVNSAVWGDYDNDGDADVFVSCYSSPSRLYRNDGGGHFTRINSGLPTGGNTMHAAWADYDGDGDLDIALCGDVGTRIYKNDGTNGFTLIAAPAGPGMVPAWADYDNDGRMDLLVVSGQGSPSRPALYHNNGNRNFTAITDALTETASYWLTCPWGDFDNDGSMDVVLTHQYGQHRLYRNLGTTNHWIKLKLVGTASNRDAIGAKVRVQATIGGESVWQTQEVNGGYAMQNDTRLNFGLGDATNVELVRIEWPSGIVQTLGDVAPGQILTVTEDRRPVLTLTTTPSAVTGTLRGERNRVYYVLVSADLANWMRFTNITANALGTATWSDSRSEEESCHFYKALLTQ